MYALAITVAVFASQIAIVQAYPLYGYTQTYVIAERDRNPLDWDWEGSPIALYDSDGWRHPRRAIQPDLICFGQGKKKRVICGELPGQMEF